jgi:glycosyltransferase involved in cell wall biosynthesis
VSRPSPRVSILLPTYNRARFLPAALGAIAAQTFQDWELVVVDDGSTDGSEAIVRQFASAAGQPVEYVYQPNAGAYAARNTALARASGAAFAFYDSDDVWLPHHLSHCVRALDDVPAADWVYAACRVVDFATGRVMDPNTFEVNGSPRPFRQLRAVPHGNVHLIDDDCAVVGALSDGLYCGLQNSVIRRRVFDDMRFQAAFRNEAEDQLFVVRALKRGYCLAYIDDVHVQYHVHDANSSAAAAEQAIDRQLAVYGPLVRGFEELRGEFVWTRAEARALARRLARDQFWHIGYAILWQGGRRAAALEAFRAGLRAWPWSPGCWKTYLLARLRTAGGGS